jgi:hypothetical protein
VRPFRSTYGLYVILVMVGTALLLHGRPPLTDKGLSWGETVLLLPGLIFYLPLMLLSGGIHWSLLPLWSQIPVWGILNVCGYLGLPLAIWGMHSRWRDGRSSYGHQKPWRELLLRPVTMVVFGFGMFFVALNGGLQIWRNVDGPTDIANVVLGLSGAIGLWTLASLEHNYGVLRRAAAQGPPAWTRWAVPLAAITGAAIGGALVYGEVRILRWSKASAGAAGLTVTALTLMMTWIIVRMVRNQR